MTSATPPDDGYPERPWVLLQINTPSDLRDHIGGVIEWLSALRSDVIDPVIATFPNEAVQLEGLGPHDSRRGEPHSLLVQTSGWTWKNRPTFAGADEPGWGRLLSRLTKGQLREFTVHVDTRDDRGVISGRSEGLIMAGAIIRDQFVIEGHAPLPADHPGQLYMLGSRALLRRLDEADLRRRLISLGDAAIRALPQATGFLEWDRPWEVILDHVRPVGETQWQR